MTKCVKWVVVKETLKKMEVIVFVFASNGTTTQTLKGTESFGPVHACLKYPILQYVKTLNMHISLGFFSYHHCFTHSGLRKGIIVFNCR